VRHCRYRVASSCRGPVLTAGLRQRAQRDASDCVATWPSLRSSRVRPRSVIAVRALTIGRRGSTTEDGGLRNPRAIIRPPVRATDAANNVHWTLERHCGAATHEQVTGRVAPEDCAGRRPDGMCRLHIPLFIPDADGFGRRRRASSTGGTSSPSQTGPLHSRIRKQLQLLWLPALAGRSPPSSN
jgi:hypothetical protein